MIREEVNETGIKESIFMADVKKISVVVPIYNVEKYLERCITSILKQTYRGLQIILVDDGSTDDSGSICDRYMDQDARVFVIHKKNEGLVEARKTGLFYAAGEYVCYVDGDDWIESDFVECLLGEMERTGTDLVVSDYFVDSICYVQKVKGKQAAGIYEAKDIIPVMLYTGEFYGFGISQFVWAKLYRKAILQNVQEQVDNRITCGEDVAVVYPYVLHAQRICCMEYAGYHYLQRPDSMTNRYGPNEWEKNKILLQYLRNTFKKSVYKQSLYRQLNQYAKNLLLVRCISYFDIEEKNRLLMPYGGIPVDGKVILYGAGKLGQSIYHYLKEHQVEVIGWLDQNYAVYKNHNMKIYPPERLADLEDHTYDYVLIAVSNQKKTEEIRKYLESMGIRNVKIRWLTTDFVKEEYSILDSIADNEKEFD